MISRLHGAPQTTATQTRPGGQPAVQTQGSVVCDEVRAPREFQPTPSLAGGRPSVAATPPRVDERATAAPAPTSRLRALCTAITLTVATAAAAPALAASVPAAPQPTITLPSMNGWSLPAQDAQTTVPDTTTRTAWQPASQDNGPVVFQTEPTAQHPQAPALRIQLPDGIPVLTEKATDAWHVATDAHPVQIGGHDFQFSPLHITADPFAQGFGKLETDVWAAHLQSDHMQFAGNWKIETGMEAGLQFRHTLGNAKDNNIGNVLQPNFFGPRVEFYQRVTLPLDGAARSDDADSLAAGHHVAPAAHSLDGNWLLRAISGGTHLFAQTEEGVEVHFDGQPVRPYLRAMTGIERDIPFGDNHGIALRMGPELRVTTSRGAQPTAYIEADYFF